MDRTTKAQEFREIFQHYLKSNARTMSVRTLLSERNLKRIDYSPYYQRNYVWDRTKQTFFIESVILGTEIPPIILFKSGPKIEVIDGRQRFETLKKFKENDFKLGIKGLKELQILKNQSFNKMSLQNQEFFLNANIRLFEFEVINRPNLDDEIIDRTKKEIFRRYNTGITPLTRDELDNAKYDNDEFSDLFRDKLRDDLRFYSRFNKCFNPKKSTDLTVTDDGLVTKNVDFIRRSRVLVRFPISTYAAGSSRTEIIDLLYDFEKNSGDNPKDAYENFSSILIRVLDIYDDFVSKAPNLANRLIFECILWAIAILDKEGQAFEYDSELFRDHYTNNQHYSEDSSHYYRKIIDRYKDTAKLFSRLSSLDFSIYIKDEHFRKKVGKLKQTDTDAAKSIKELSNLRLHKPNPISTPIDEIRQDLKSTSRFLLRPSYQRQEKISIIKASSIIESILLGINLPPIFIFKRKNNLKEVVDGQQRLLAIIGFLGDSYNNENGQKSYSKKSNYKLRGLKILTNLEGKNFSALNNELQDKILDFVVDLIIIEESVNEKFDPIDLFIRLNYKPYPIKSNSFELWNSTVNFQVITKIKEVAAGPYKSWFFLRELGGRRPDRMLNEELIAILSFITYNSLQEKPEEVIGFFQRIDRITCRLKDKRGLGDFLTNLDNWAQQKSQYLQAIDKTKELILHLESLFDEVPTKDSFNDFLNLKEQKIFRRSLQDFYVIWLILVNIRERDFQTEKTRILNDITRILRALKNVDGASVDKEYLDNFIKELKGVTDYYSHLA